MNLREITKRILVISLVLIICVFIINLITSRINTIKKIATSCDHSNNATCDYYQIKNFNK